jgi:hypothetical protein
MPTLITASGPATDEETTAQAQHLLDQFLKRVRELGVKAEGEFPIAQGPLAAAGEVHRGPGEPVTIGGSGLLADGQAHVDRAEQRLAAQ